MKEESGKKQVELSFHGTLETKNIKAVPILRRLSATAVRSGIRPMKKVCRKATSSWIKGLNGKIQMGKPIINILPA